MNSILGFVVGLLQSAMSLLGFVQQHPELPQPVQDQAVQVATQAVGQATQALSQTNTQQSASGTGLVITAPSTGGNVAAGEQVTIRWTIPSSVISSFPSDFNLGLFLDVVRSDNPEVNVYGINDGTNDPGAGSVVWKVPADVKPGSYKIVGYLQATPKDYKRMCDPAYSAHKDCSPNPTDAAVMKRAAPYKAESSWFAIGVPLTSATSLSGTTKEYNGTWFKVLYPENFAAKKEGSDEASFTSADGAVQFFVYSPQWAGEPVSYLQALPTETVESDSSTPETTSSTNMYGTMYFKKVTRYVTFVAKDGSYKRSFVSVTAGYVSNPDAADYSSKTHMVFGIKYANQAAYDKYLQQYLAFKKSLTQYAD